MGISDTSKEQFIRIEKLGTLMTERLTHLLGRPATHVYVTLFELNPSITALAVAPYYQPPNIQGRATLTVMERSLADTAVGKRATSLFSYLEILLALSSEAEHSVEGILDAVEYHQSHPSHRTWLSRDAVLKGQLVQMCSQIASEEHLAVFSVVRSQDTDNNRIPLLDLRIEKTKQSLRIACSIAQRLLPQGFAVLATARSFHLVGFDLLSGAGELSFLARALLFLPITDHAYIAHQLVEGEACLRVSSREAGVPEPRVVAVGDREAVTIESNAPAG